MDFTYNSYECLIERLREAGYNNANYHNWNSVESPIIYRHDIDCSVDKAIAFAEIENHLGVQSTYFVLTCSDLYNIFSKKNIDKLKKIKNLGHEIGLHFDEVKYSEIKDIDRLIPEIIKEANFLSGLVDDTVDVVSMHRPSKAFLEANLKIPGIINSYGSEFIKDFKYLSDSRRRWREPVIDIIKSKKYERLHILTHPFWYSVNEKDISESLRVFVDSARIERYEALDENFTHLEEVLKL